MSDVFAASPMVHALGWALLHSLWQGALTGALTAVVLTACRRSAARRYVVACAGLVAMVTLPAITALTYAGRTRPDVTSIGMAAPSAEGSSQTSADRAPVPLDRQTSRPRAISTGAAVHWSRPRLEAWSIIVVPVWLLGVLVFSCRLAAGWLVVRRFRRTGHGTCRGRLACPCPDDRGQAAPDPARAPCGVGARRCAPRSRVASSDDSPAQLPCSPAFLQRSWKR